MDPGCRMATEDTRRLRGFNTLLTGSGGFRQLLLFKRLRQQRVRIVGHARRDMCGQYGEPARRRAKLVQKQLVLCGLCGVQG
jgi:hypothetical protein